MPTQMYVKTQDTQPRQLKVVGVIEGDYATQGQYVDLTGQAGLSYTSSDEGVASVDANGYLSVNDYGIATVTVTDGTTTASMLVTVTAEGFLGDNAGKTSYDSDSGYAFNEKVVQETELVRPRRRRGQSRRGRDRCGRLQHAVQPMGAGGGLVDYGGGVGVRPRQD